MNKEKIFVSVSAGRTSSVMAEYVLKIHNSISKLNLVPVFGSSGKPKYHKHVNDKVEIIFGFMNTSREDKRTYTFLRQLDKYLGLKMVCLEAVVNPTKGKGITSKIVDIKHLKTNGSVFEAHIAKYGIPSTEGAHCTRDLKEGNVNNFFKSINWTLPKVAIGYRADEPKRVNLIKALKKNQWYPLFEIGFTKEIVNTICSKRPFDLPYTDEYGNCIMCFKKSRRKLLTLLKRHPELAEWFIEMERKYSWNESKKQHIYFFRGNDSIFDLLKEMEQPFIEYSEDKTQTKIIFDFELDEQDSCAESCEVFAD